MVAETFPITWSIFHEDTLDLFNFVFPFPLYFSLSHLPAGGLTELVGKFHNSRPMYGLCRVGLTETGQPQIVMVCWVSSHAESVCLCQFISAIINIYTEM